ncbi:hypothetical protein ACTQ56_03270 [[Clostridium] aminophilum]|uniref:hypothetical protein n=1 Tax=[Clostridium] aminophilum TaxID=1526 RepID=UPI0026EF3BBA|nr:hypothetical protein [[Clostridium] aminophilum]MDD6197135.1 hypothetical protein [[Clostridium] aminophilum]
MEYEIGFRIGGEPNSDGFGEGTESENGTAVNAGEPRDINVPAFMRSLRNMRRNEMIKCPFCTGGSVSFFGQDGSSDVFSCDRCATRVEIRSGAHFVFG